MSASEFLAHKAIAAASKTATSHETRPVENVGPYAVAAAELLHLAEGRDNYRVDDEVAGLLAAAGDELAMADTA